MSHLEALAHSLNIEIRYESMDSETAFSSGGLCRIKDKQYIIVNAKAPTGEKVRILVRALRRFDLSQVYLRPAIRALLEDHGDIKD